MNSGQFLEVSKLPSAQDMLEEEEFVFHEEDVPCHRLKIVPKWFHERQISNMNCPPQILDLNPIEIL